MSEGEPPAGPQPETDPKPAESKWEKRFAGYKERLLEVAILTAPLAVLQGLSRTALDELTSQPWQALVVLIPLGVMAWALWRRALRPRHLRVTGRLLAFLGVYVLVFSVAAQSRVLDWQVRLTGYEEVTPANPLGMARLGDWRYWLVDRTRPDGIAVVLMDPAEPEQRRMELIHLIGVAHEAEVRGMALDFWFVRETLLDSSLCAALDITGLPVFVGFGIEWEQETPVAAAFPRSLAGCLPPERRGHLLVFLEQDERVRSVPLHFQGEEAQDLPALSLRAARFLRDGEVVEPRDGLLRFIPPGEGLHFVRFTDLGAQVGLLRRRFILVGEDSERDRFRTPHGELPGVALHAAALHSLLEGRFLERASGWPTFVFLLLGGYGLLGLVRAGAPVRMLLEYSGVLSVAVLAAAAVATRTWGIWVDVGYALVGLWLLLAALLPVRRRVAAAAASPSTRPPTPP